MKTRIESDSWEIIVEQKSPCFLSVREPQKFRAQVLWYTYFPVSTTSVKARIESDGKNRKSKVALNSEQELPEIMILEGLLNNVYLILFQKKVFRYSIKSKIVVSC